MKPQPDHCHRDIIGKPKPWSKEDWNRLFPQIGDKQIEPPYRPGDVFRFREAYADVHPCQIDEGRYSVQSRAGIPGPPSVTYRLIYQADGPYHRCVATDSYPWRQRREGFVIGAWTWARSQTLKEVRHAYTVAGVRGEYLPEISEADALKCAGSWQGPTQPFDLVIRYKKIWHALHGKRYPWESWVCVVDLER
jgi:hypothetical protein